MADPEVDGTIRYGVGKFELSYAREHPGHPPLTPVGHLVIVLGEVQDGYVAPREGIPWVGVSLAEFTGEPVKYFYGSAIRAIVEEIVGYYNREGLVGVFVAPHEGDVDPRNSRDLRPEARRDLRIVIWTTIVTQARSVASGERIPAADRINSPLHASILERSPVRPVVAGEPGERRDLLYKDALDDYVFRLNRHPARRVDLALSSAGAAGEGVLDYLVTESKQWLLFAQASNTGTKETTEWRERIGFVHHQLTNRDDVLNVDYITGDFKDVHAVIASYEGPLYWDFLRWRAFGEYSEFDASEVGVTNVEFTGRERSGGAELILNILQARQSFLDLIAGFQWRSIMVNNQTLKVKGDEDFALPSLSLRFERRSDTSSTVGKIGGQLNLDKLSGTDEEEAEKLGRFDVDRHWAVLKMDFAHSFFIEPLFKAREWQEKGLEGATMAHELVFAARGQFAGGYRLIPQAEEVLGGRYTVRGYPESVVAGDTVALANLEYRYHIPRALRPDPSARTTLFGRPFRFRPQQPLSRPDWDLVACAFIDWGRTWQTNETAFEDEDELIGTGVGLELQVSRSFNVRADWGVALRGTLDEEVDAGDSRVHLVGTFVW